MKRYLFILFFSFTACGLTLAAGDAERGKSLSSTCAACHGADGNSFAPMWPKLAGQHANYIVEQIKLFQKGKDGGRYDPTMAPMIANLSEQDMQDLAAYFAEQKMQIGTPDPALADRGKRLFLGGDLEKNIPACSACHAPNGMGNSQALFPRIGGQHAQYIIDSLQKFKDKERHSTKLQIMQPIAARMSEEDMQAVASYITGLPDNT